MSIPQPGRTAAVAGLAVGALILSACSAGSLGTSSTAASGAPAATTITVLADSSDQTVKPLQALIDAFNAKNTGVTVKLETRAQGTDGDNSSRPDSPPVTCPTSSSTTPVR